MGLEQQAGWNYVQSIENSSKLLNQVSKAWKILTTRTPRTYDTRFSNLELCSIDCTYSDGCWSPTIFLFLFGKSLNLKFWLYRSSKTGTLR